MTLTLTSRGRYFHPHGFTELLLSLNILAPFYTFNPVLQNQPFQGYTHIKSYSTVDNVLLWSEQKLLL